MKMMNKFCSLMLSAVLCAGMAAPAFAYGGEPVEEAEQPVLTSTTDEEDAVTVTDEENGALTPEGNLTLVDDYHTSYSDGSGQQFITLVSKSGNTFYLVIDRNAKGQQTVHFMNLVDEADLLALMEEDAADSYTAEKEAAAQAEQDKLKAEEEAKKAEEEAATAEPPKENKITKYAGAFLGIVALIALAAAFISLCFMLVISHYSRVNAPVEAQANRDMTGAILEYARGLAVVKSFGKDAAALDTIHQSIADSKNIHLKIEWGYLPQITYRCAEVAKEALAAGKDPVEAIVENTVESLNRRYSTMQIVGDHLAELIPQGGTILTQCFGETIIGTVIRAARRQNKDFKVFCAETRPYLQGARLTSGCFAQMGFDTTVITDNMVAYAMEREGIDLFTSAADTIARDGHIANKIGTFQMAILAKYFGIPYYVTGIPDQDKHSKDDIVIEMRDPAQVLSYRGIPNTVPEVKAIYPSFDVVPPHLISGVVTDKGVYVPYLLDHYFDSDVKKFY